MLNFEDLYHPHSPLWTILWKVIQKNTFIGVNAQTFEVSAQQQIYQYETTYNKKEFVFAALFNFYACNKIIWFNSFFTYIFPNIHIFSLQEFNIALFVKISKDITENEWKVN